MKYQPLYLLPILLSAITGTVSAQSDSTEYLFKRARYSYIQYSIGYSPMFFNHDQVGNGYSASLIGVVLNDKIAFGLDFDGFSKSVPFFINEYPVVTSMVYMSLNIEPLIRPRKVINFSFPCKIGYGGAQIYEISPGGFATISNPEFGIIQPGSMVWINLFKPLSLGVGGSYRMAFNKHPETFDKFSGFSGFAMLRFKFYTREYMAKMAERQKLYMQQQAPR